MACRNPPCYHDSRHKAEKWTQAFKTSTLAARQGWCGGTRGSSRGGDPYLRLTPYLILQRLFCDRFTIARKTVQGLKIHAKPVANFSMELLPVFFAKNGSLLKVPRRFSGPGWPCPSWPYLLHTDFLLAVMSEGHLWKADTPILAIPAARVRPWSLPTIVSGLGRLVGVRVCGNNSTSVSKPSTRDLVACLFIVPMRRLPDKAVSRPSPSHSIFKQHTGVMQVESFAGR